jgi:hypothetical protein
MKIIGKNSISQYISYLLFVLFIILTAIFIYEQIGYATSYYNFKTNSLMLSDFYTIGNDVGWAKNHYTAKLDDLMKFKFYVPFTTQNLITGIFSLTTYISNTLRGIFMIAFFYSSYNIFKEISNEKVFNLKAILWLKRFGLLNILYTVAMIVISIFRVNDFGITAFSAIPFLFFGVLILFIVEFFKKGYNLQSENDLTI